VIAPGRPHERQIWRIRLFASEELARMFSEHGLVDVAVTAGFASHDEPPLLELREYTPSSPRILVRGRKPR
jgi:hypothetical protein